MWPWLITVKATNEINPEQAKLMTRRIGMGSVGADLGLSDGDKQYVEMIYQFSGGRQEILKRITEVHIELNLKAFSDNPAYEKEINAWGKHVPFSENRLVRILQMKDVWSRTDLSKLFLGIWRALVSKIHVVSSFARRLRGVSPGGVPFFVLCSLFYSFMMQYTNQLLSVCSKRKKH
jgi:hypothetical protein